MSDEFSPTPPAGGQTESAPWAQGQTETAPQSQDGQATTQTTQDQGQASGTPATDDQSFFDPSSLPPELLVPYKKMQGAYTTKTQEIARQKQKIEAYDAFMRDPVGQIQQLASQYGMQLTRAQAQQVANEQQAQQTQDWQPQTWDELLSKAEERAEQRVMQRLAPYLGQVQKMQAGNIEKQLSSIDPEWRNYENNMRDILNAHPTMVNDVATLYRMAVPQETLEATAIQKALKKFEDKGQHQAVASKTTGPKSSPSTAKVNSFDEAYREAKRKIASGEV